MIDNTVSTSKVLMAVLWGVVVLLGIAAWGLGIGGEWHWSVLVGLTACATSAAAATSHIRCYAVRLCCLIKAMQAHTLDEYRRG